MLEKTKLTIREVSGYPFRLEGETEDGRHVLIYVKHDELFVTVGNQQLYATMDALQMSQAHASTPEVSNPTPPA